MIPLRPGMEGVARAFLGADPAGAMFPLVNLTPQGLPMRAWVAREGGQVRAFLGLVEGGMAMPVAAPGWQGWADARPVLAGAALTGMIGRPATVAALRAALGLAGAAARKDGIEQGFTLDLADLRMPEVEGRALVPLDDGWRALAERWRAAYEVEALGAHPDQAAVTAPATVARWLAQGSHRLLLERGVPVALTGFNADLGALVQVGGVWTPPEGRGRGRARAAVALHLAEARGRGATRAVLFAVSDMAARAYAAIGFRLAGQMALVLFDGPQTVAP